MSVCRIDTDREEYIQKEMYKKSFRLSEKDRQREMERDV